MEDDDHMIISPEGIDDIESSPYVRLYPASDVAPPIDRSEWETYEDYIQIMANWLGTNFNVDSALVVETLSSFAGCARRPMFSFSVDGRTGYVQYLGGQTARIAEVSAPDEIYPDYAEVLTQMQEAFRTGFGCG